MRGSEAIDKGGALGMYYEIVITEECFRLPSVAFCVVVLCFALPSKDSARAACHAVRPSL